MKNHLWTIISLSHFGLQKWLTLIDVGRKLSCFGAKMVIASVTWLAKIQKKKKEICCSMSFAFSLSCLFNEANLKNRRRCLRICRRKSFQLEHGNHHSNVIFFFWYENIPMSSLLQGTFIFAPQKFGIFLLKSDLFWESTLAGVLYSKPFSGHCCFAIWTGIDKR